MLVRHTHCVDSSDGFHPFCLITSKSPLFTEQVCWDLLRTLSLQCPSVSQSVSLSVVVVVVIIIIIIIIIRNQLDLKRPVSPSSSSLFKGLPSRLRPFGLQFSIIVGILFLFILVIRLSRFDLYLPSFSTTGFTFNSSKISSFLL
jgi:hypothetical protein